MPPKVLVYCLFWVSPDFFPHTKKLVQTAFVWVKTLVTLYGCRPTYGTPQVLRCKGIWGAATQASSPLGQRRLLADTKKILTRYHSNFLIRFSCHANVMVVRPPSTILSYVASTETMISVRGRTFLLGRKIDKGKQKKSSGERGNDITVRKQNNTESGQLPLSRKAKLKKSLMMIKDPEDKSRYLSIKPTSKVVYAHVVVRYVCSVVLVASTPSSSTQDPSHPLVIHQPTAHFP